MMSTQGDTNMASPSITDDDTLEMTLQEALQNLSEQKYDQAVQLFRDDETNTNSRDRLLDLLISKLLTTTINRTDSGAEEGAVAVDPYLHLVVLLVRYQSSTKNWMIPISKSLLNFLKQQTSASVVETLSPPSTQLLEVWVEQMIMSDSTQIHDNLSQSLDLLLQVHKSDSTSTLVLQQLATLWKKNLESKSTSVNAVRCVQSFIQIWSTQTTDSSSTTSPHPEIITQMAQELLLPMMTNGHDDPLLQISVLDMVLQEVQSSNQGHLNAAMSDLSISPSGGSNDTKDLNSWLAASLPWTSLLESKDSFQFASAVPLAAEVFDSLTPENQSLLLKHAILEQIGTTTNETERLLVCQTLLSIFTTPSPSPEKLNHNLHILEGNVELRKCWWGDIGRIHVPKLQAAVLISFSKLLEAAKVSKVYTWLGMDNNNNFNTTEWVYDKFVKSPIPELRIAAYTIWIALLTKVPNGGLLLGQTTIGTFQEWLVRRETTHDARSAKYEVVKAMFASSSLITGGDPKFAQLIQKQYELGPHGLEPMGWDTMMVE